MTIHALDKNLSLASIPVGYRDRPQGSESKLNTVSDGCRVLKTIVRLFKDYKPLLFFGLLSLIVFVVALILFIPVFIEYGRTGLVRRLPTLVTAGFMGMAALLLLVCGLISACGLMGGNGSAGLTPAAQAAPAAKANAFNPWMNKSLPNTRTLSAEGLAMVQAMGADRQSIEDEAAHRPHWREEIYPVFFGNRTAPHEIIVLLDFAAPDSARVWQAVRDASARLSPADVKIAVFAKNSENYGTDLMGMGIWISYERKGQAIDYMSHALSEWNRIKAAQKKQGRSVPFTNEYDATVTSTDLPIHYAFMGKLRPAVPASQELDVARYCYNAGNVNMYQAVQISRYYGVKRIPAVIVDGRVLASPSAQDIVSALR